MPAKIDQSLLPPVIRESVDPEILARAQSIEWSIDRDTGDNEHGYLDNAGADHQQGLELARKSRAAHLAAAAAAERKSRKLEWFDSQQQRTLSGAGGRDSGFEATPISPSLGGSRAGGLDMSALDEAVSSTTPLGDLAHDYATTGSTLSNNTGSMKRHPLAGAHGGPFPIYRVNQEQLQGDVVFEAAPRARPGERTVHYEKSSRIVHEEDLNALGLDPSFFGPNSKAQMNEQEEETVETSVLKGGARELEQIFQSMRTEAGDYFDRQRARSLSPSGGRATLDGETSESQRRTVVFGSVDEIDNVEQEYYPYRDAHQGKPLPGDNEYGTWGSRFDDKRQWKLCNGQWVRVAEPKKTPPPPQEEPEQEKYIAERVKCTILLEPPRPPTPPIEEIKVEPIQPTYVEMKKPLKQPEGEEEKMMEDPNLMWMHMGPAQYGPPFGTMRRGKAREEEWVGPPCELCHKQIEERRCMLAENMKFHCWHFACSFCLKTLKPADFLIAEADRKPYCLNCHKREFPEIPLAGLKLEE